jgi:hypothetical protein
MNVVDKSRDSIDLIRSAAKQGPGPKTIDTVHKCMVDIAKMRLSTERAIVQVGRSWNAVLDSKELLERLRREGF